MYFKGPSPSWQTVEITIGPKGSGAKYTWPDGVTWIGLGGLITAKGTVYVDDVTMTPVDR